ncbi:carboxymuconolactone decarboxylase family protein [Phycicoccus ginsengisoli]
MRISAGTPFPAGGSQLVERMLDARRGLSSVAVVADEAGNLMGPFSCLPHSPDIGDALQRVGTAIRTQSTLDRTVTEAVILTVAQHWQADYEWYAHTAVARAEGLLTEAELELIRTGQPGLTDAAADLAAAFTRELLAGRSASRELETQLMDVLSTREAVEVVMVAGYYSALALLIRAFETPMPESADAG